jgi:puromycin-sensitive aminopeptidase
MVKSAKRLYEQFQPKHYDLTLHPNRKDKTFTGKVIVEGLKVGQPTNRLVFHQNELTITSAKLIYRTKKGDSEVPISRINHHRKYDEVRIHSSHQLRPGAYLVEIHFKGKITKVMNGIYPCFFKYKGKPMELIATQFESHFARQVFPSIDEPQAKATFDLTLTSPKDEIVIANTPIKTQTVEKNTVTTVFETTPKMSTYLLAFVYGKLGYVEAKTKSGVKIKAYATPDNVEHLKFALDVAVKCLDFYGDYFDIDYPLPKLDLIALPDFAAGAMENWGCVTFREQALLVDDDNTSLANKQYVALVVAHELAHQWFGNLVTMRWWTDLWLNEGFASWMEYLAVDHIFPEWQLWVQFAVDERSQALALDELENTHEIETKLTHPDEIRTIFDAIAYSKGASIINMLFHFLGKRDFKQGLRYYLEKYSYGNTETTDLWLALQEISKKPVKEFMHQWTSKPGYPLLECSVEDEAITIHQNRFFINPHHKVEDKTVWPVALISNDSDLPDLLDGRVLKAKSKVTDKLLINEGQAGFYRVTYNPAHLERLGQLIKRGHIEPIDRLGILSDVFETSKAGRSDTGEALHFISYFDEEDNFAVWDVIVSSIASVRMVMADDELREAMKPYVRLLIAAQLKRLGIKRKANESHFDRLLRPTIVGMAAGADEPKIVEYCLDLFSKIESVDSISTDLRSIGKPGAIKRGLVIDPDLRGAVFGTVARLGGEKEFKKLLNLHNQATMSEERVTLAAALTGFKQPELIKRALSLITSDDVRVQDVTYWIAYSFMNRFAKKYTWNWLKKNWSWLEDNMGTDLSFYRMPIYAARAFTNEDFIDEYKEFFKSKMSPALERSYKQGVEILEYQSAWRDRSFKEVKTFFNEFNKNASS